MTSISFKRAMFLWSLANLFFAFQFILRLSAGILREEIIQKFTIDTASFGTLAGFYYLGYSGSQIPLGIMLDRLSFRFVTSIAVATAAIGTLMFVTTDSWNMLLFSRFLIGVGSGVAFLSVAKIIKNCFDKKYHSAMLGFSFSFGLIGAVFGATPMKFLFDQFGYEYIFCILSIVGFIIAVIILALGKLENDSSKSNTAKDTFKAVVKLITNPKIILIGVSGGLMVGSLEGFADVWAIPFFNQSFGMSKTDSTTITSFVYVGMCFGGPILTLTATALRSTNFTIFLTGILTVAVFAILFYIPAQYFNFISSAAVMFFLGILCCYQVLVFIAVSNAVDKNSTGLAIAVANCVNMSFGHFFHTIIGSAFESSWDRAVTDYGSPLYTHENFIYALAIIPICCFIGQFGFALLEIKSKKVTITTE
jgi:predicted MFS family arabinose efflux permease